MNVTTIFWVFLIGYGLLSLLATLIILSAIVQASRMEQSATDDLAPTGKPTAEIRFRPLPKRAPPPTLTS